MKRVAFVVLLLALPLLSQETYIRDCGTRAACTLGTNISWTSGNQIWRFSPINPNESFRIWVHNNNPTSAHTSQAVQVFVTDQNTVDAFSLTNNSDQWVQAAVIDNVTASAKCTSVAANAPTATPGPNGKGTCYSNAMYAAQIAVRITGAASQTGSPDTFDIGIVQQAGMSASGPQPGYDTSAGGGGTIITASSAASYGVTPVVSGATETSHVLKAGPGNLYSVYVTTGSTAGFLMVHNSTTAPAPGAVTPLVCTQAPANQTTSVSFYPGPPAIFSVGISATFSTTGCFTQTNSATAYIGGVAI